MPESKSPSEPPVLDRAHLADVTAGDAELCVELVALYSEHGDGDRERIARAVAHEDREGLRLLAHGMKGASASLGAVRAARAFAALEHGAAEASAEGLRAIAAAAQTAYEEACVALEAVSREMGEEN